MPAMRGLLAPQNTFLDTIATRFDGTRESRPSPHWLPDQLSLASVPVSPAPRQLSLEPSCSRPLFPEPHF